jgi:hypothetical protein
MVIAKGHCTDRDIISVIVRVKSNVPDCVGVPKSTAVFVVTVSPGGNPVADHVNGGVNAPPDAVNVVAV